MKKYKIVLVNPVKSNGQLFFPSGLCYLSSYLKRESGDQVNISILNISIGNLESILSLNPDLIGITSLTHTFNLACEIGTYIRKNKKDVILVLGGQHISMAPWSMPKVFDYGIIGEGEKAFLLLVNSLINNNKELSHIGNLQYWQDGRLIQNEKLPLISPLDGIPFPDWEILSNIEEIISADSYQNFNRTNLRTMQITTSRGCPYKCVFCQPTKLWGRYRMHTSEYIAEEVKYVHNRFGINAILIEDDLFTGNKKRVSKLIEYLCKYNLYKKISYYVAGRASQIDREWVNLFNELGVIKVELGIESGSDKIANFLKKGNDSTEKNMEAIEILNNSGISVYASFIVGSPEETEDDLKLTWKMIRNIRKNHKNNTCGICLATPLPGTELWDYAINNNIIKKNEISWEKLSTLERIPKQASNIYYLNKHIPVKRLLKIIIRMNLKLRLGPPGHFIRNIPRRLLKRIKILLRRI